MQQPAGSNADNITLAVAAILFTAFALSLGDAFIKRFSTDFPLWQIFVLRSALALPVVTAAIRFGYKGVSLLPRFVKWTVIRSLLLTLMWVAYYMALPHIALSVAAAAFYTLPLFITLFAALFLGETIGRKGWVAVLLGFLGVLLILKPQADDFTAYALLPVVSAILYALAMIITRSKCRQENALVLSLTFNITMIVFGAAATLLIGLWNPSGPVSAANAFLLGPWTSMDPAAWRVMGLLALALIVGSVGAAIAYQSGPSSVVGAFDFSYVAFAAAWGVIFFSEVPDAVTVGGMALIVCGGVLSMRRHRSRAPRSE